jgi:hypothetical protein
MEYPLIDRTLLSKLRLVHAGFNTLVMLMFFYHARLGITIRKARKARGPLPFQLIKRHRKEGPILAGAGIAGFCIGLTLVLLHTGRVLEYPYHFLTGCVIVICITATFVISRGIKGSDSPFRTPHFILGIAILCLYLIEVLLGIGVLL